MTTPSRSHLVLIPSFNTGPILTETVRAARGAWDPVWVVVDGSTDGSDDAVAAMAAADPGLRLLRLPRNAGKGAALLQGMEAAMSAGFTHALAMDADGQHPSGEIVGMMAASAAAPRALVLGLPVFGPEAPALRVRGRRVSNFWANLETLWAGIGDSLFGFRVYPLAPLAAEMRRTRWMRRYDFDAEAAVRLAWRGLPLINRPVPVRYLAREEGGVSHFRYGRDNLLLTGMHLRLMAGFLLRLPMLAARRLTRPRPAAATLR
ncbi:glycosyltransferase family 2 protein [Teichococcus vastitatis]|uniref:Glycosyltransferase family 2 protein n=1 Tax=Teichococcus vastitatis TaxID=2307076 RepID=A0ABS9W4A8_9PROT|nr:glycosyltransferase family 2 protein [Pseudoroseomonas vastitatis]MCI0754016.1 glycosyltransferase family 2 protein [Pseudoroseomonas vastitatis]